VVFPKGIRPSSMGMMKRRRMKRSMSGVFEKSIKVVLFKTYRVGKEGMAGVWIDDFHPVIVERRRRRRHVKEKKEKSQQKGKGAEGLL
jgi:hypothetical protein